MDKFNLTFNGKIVDGFDLPEVKKRFAETLLIDDPERVEQFFSGKVVTIRRNLDKDAATAFYTKMYRVGVVLTLDPSRSAPTGETSKPRIQNEFRKERPGSVDQSWPIRSSTPKTKKTPPPPINKPGNAVKQAEEQARVRDEESARIETEKTRKLAKEASIREAEEVAKREADALAEKRKAAEEAVERETREAAKREAEEQRKREEEAARVKAEKKRLKAEEAAKRKAEALAAKKKAAAEAAKIRAEEKRKREEETARVKAEQKRLKAEETAKRKAEALAAKKKAAAEAAKIRAEEKRKREEETARVKAEQKRLKAEETAKRKAEALAAKKKAAEEAAKVRAEEKRKREEETARVKAEQKRLKAEEASERKALALVAKKKAAEEAAKKRAEEKAQLEAEKERMLAQEVARQEAEKAALREQAAALDVKKKADEEAAIQAAFDRIARKKAEEEAAAQQALKLAERKRAKEEEARLRTELSAHKRKHAEAAARAKADEERIEDALRTLAAQRKNEETNNKQSIEEDKQQRLELEEAQKKEQRLAQEKAAERRAQERLMEQEALQRAAAGTARLEELQRAAEVTPEPTAKAQKKPAPKQTKPPKEVSSKPTVPAGLPGTKRQPGAPNLFNLKPFRNTAEIRQRAAASLQLMKVMYIASVVALITLLVLGARYALLPMSDAGVTHAETILTNQHSSLFIAAGNELYVLDRSGTDSKQYRFTDFGIDTGATLLDFDPNGKLLIQGRPAAGSDEASSAQRLLRCDLQLTTCEAFAADLPNGEISDWITDIRTGDSFVAIASENSLSRLAQDGSSISQQTVAMESGVKLTFHEGLLYMNNSANPAIGVFRPDSKGFGQQLDDILLLPQRAQEQGHTRVSDFLWSSASWWVIMTNPEADSGAVYRFDANWKSLPTISMPSQSLPQQLLAWSSKILVVDSRNVDIARFNDQGEAELPLTPKALAGDINSKHANLTQSRRLWYACLGFLALLGIVAYVLGRLHQIRALVYKADNVRGAEPIDDKIKAIRWIELHRRKSATFKQLVALLATITILVIGTLIYQIAPINIVLAAIIFFSGPAIGLTLMAMSKPGHIGVLNDRLILVDHNNNYHIDGGARIHYRNNFLLLDDIAVYVGNKLLPVFSTEQLAQSIAPLARAGVKVDRKTVLVKLGQSAHPLTRALIACAVCLGGALFCLLLY